MGRSGRSTRLIEAERTSPSPSFARKTLTTYREENAKKIGH